MLAPKSRGGQPQIEFSYSLGVKFAEILHCAVKKGHLIYFNSVWILWTCLQKPLTWQKIWVHSICPSEELESWNNSWRSPNLCSVCARTPAHAYTHTHPHSTLPEDHSGCLWIMCLWLISKEKDQLCQSLCCVFSKSGQIALLLQMLLLEWDLYLPREAAPERDAARSLFYRQNHLPCWNVICCRGLFEVWINEKDKHGDCWWFSVTWLPLGNTSLFLFLCLSSSRLVNKPKPIISPKTGSSW